jgi:hypothetical protein
VHVLTPDSGGALSLSVKSIQDTSFNLAIDTYAPGALFDAASFPPGVAVGDGNGGVDPALDAANEWPWCVDDTTATPAQASWLQANAIPVCPKTVKDASHACATAQPGATCFGDDDANRWAVRGAINAGFSVFLYVQSLETAGAAPDYNQCTLLK